MALEADINSFLDPILGAFVDNLVYRLNGYLVTAYLRGSAQMIEWGRTKTTDMPIYYEGPPIQEAIDYAQKHTATLVKGLNDETRERLRGAIETAIKEKRGIDGLARDLRREFDAMTKNRSLVIARTETCDALEQAFMDRSKDLGITGKEWVTHDPCDICQANEDAGVLGINETFPSGDDRPPSHPNCLLPDIRVESPFSVAASRAWYHGDAIKLTTQNGHDLTITPNHMILTPLGFVKAKFLNEGDYVIGCIDSKRITYSIDPYNDHSPTFISDIWDSFLMKNPMMVAVVPTSCEDFYGDAGGFNGDVHIIGADSFLRGDIGYSFYLEHISKHNFYWRYAKFLHFTGFGPARSFTDGDLSTPYGFMGGRNPSLTLCGSHSSHTNNVGLATIARHDPCLQESPADNSSVYAELARQFQFRFSGLVSPEQIDKIRNFNYSGHVYDLESLEQLYIANNIVVKNCRCALAPVMLE